MLTSLSTAALKSYWYDTLLLFKVTATMLSVAPTVKSDVRNGVRKTSEKAEQDARSERTKQGDACEGSRERPRGTRERCEGRRTFTTLVGILSVATS